VTKESVAPPTAWPVVVASILRLPDTEAHMRQAIVTVVLAGVAATPAWAQNGADRYQERNEGGRYSAEAQGVPPGYLPEPGTCRVWYDGRPAGHQARPTSCQAAERVARRDRAARVIYGGGEASDRESRPVPYEQGFKDGRDAGRDDRRDDKRFDPTDHDRYRAADRGFERPHGDKDAYRDTYREGFRAGYAEGYRGVMTTSRER
jgi:hypothetical protein